MNSPQPDDEQARQMADALINSIFGNFDLVDSTCSALHLLYTKLQQSGFSESRAFGLTKAWFRANIAQALTEAQNSGGSQQGMPQ